MSQADEIAQLYHLRFDWVSGSELFERLIDCKELVVVAWKRQLHLVHLHPLLSSAVAHGLSTPSAFDEDSPHCFGRSGEEVSAVLKCRRWVIDEAQPGLVDEGSGLERLSGGFMGHPARSQPAQLLIDQRQQLLGRFGIAALDRVEQLGRLTHAARNVATKADKKCADRHDDFLRDQGLPSTGRMPVLPGALGGFKRFRMVFPE